MLTPAGGNLCGLDPATLFAPVADLETIGLAVSGGADSLALLVLFAALKAPRPRAIVYTLDHGLRAEARAEAEMVVRAAERLGLDARLLTWAGPRPATGRQEAARAARYRLIGEAMRADGAQILVVAHHRRDQAETVLMRLAHGSGVTGLGGMRAFSEIEGVRLFRPLLEVAPETLATIVARAGLAPAADPSNADPSYERTRWRQALPGLAALGLTEQRLSLAARRLQRIDAFAQEAARAFLAEHGALDPLGVVSVPLAPLRAADPEIAIRVFARLLTHASGGQRPGLAKVEDLLDRLAATARLATTLGGVRLATRGETLLAHREAGRIAARTLAVPAGESLLWDGRFTISAQAEAVTVAPGAALTRADFERLTGQRLASPVAALRAAPVVRDGTGNVLAIGGHRLEGGLAIVQPALTG